MQIKKLSFPGSQDHQLGARLDLPDEGEPAAYALFAHCFTCTKDLKSVSNIDKVLTDQGIAVLRFDFTGLGESEGDFADTSFTSNVEDLIAAWRFLETDYRAPKLMIGHSLGGAAVIHAARHIPSCRAVATIAAPAELTLVSQVFRSSREQIERDGEAEVMLAGRPVRIKKQFFDDLEQASMERAISGLGRALLIVHSPRDISVPIDNAHRIFATAKHPKSFVALDRADHLLMNKRDSDYAGAIIATWASRYF